VSRTINRTDFARELSAGGGFLNVNDLDPDTAAALKAAGVSKKDLARIAGSDGQISGKEFQNLFDVLETAERDAGSTLTLAGAKDEPTLSGEALADLRAEIDRNRQAASGRGIIHLGMRAASQSEVDALKTVTPESTGGVHAIKAYASDGVVELDGKKYDLRDGAQIAKFAEAMVKGSLGMPAEQALRFAKFLAAAPTGTADELAQLGLALLQVGDGRLPANRLVLSGHGDGTELLPDRGNSLKHQDLRDLAAIFPEGARNIEHLALSSCFSGTNPKEWREFRSVFPNLKSLTGYAEYSPSAEKGSPKDLTAWAGKTDGDDPSQVDPTGRNSATWNVADGNQNLPHLSVRDCQRIGAEAERQVKKWTGAKNPAAGANDPALRQAYIEVARALNAEGLPEALRTQLTNLKTTLWDLRHP
jgi:hypothetical protein